MSPPDHAAFLMGCIAGALVTYLASLLISALVGRRKARDTLADRVTTLEAKLDIQSDYLAKALADHAKLLNHLRTLP